MENQWFIMQHMRVLYQQTPTQKFKYYLLTYPNKINCDIVMYLGPFNPLYNIACSYVRILVGVTHTFKIQPPRITPGKSIDLNIWVSLKYLITLYA